MSIPIFARRFTCAGEISGVAMTRTLTYGLLGYVHRSYAFVQAQILNDGTFVFVFLSSGGCLAPRPAALPPSLTSPRAGPQWS